MERFGGGVSSVRCAAKSERERTGGKGGQDSLEFFPCADIHGPTSYEDAQEGVL